MFDQLSERQQQILSFIAQYISQHQYPPSLREIGTHCGIKSTQGISRHLDKLEELGLITRKSSARSLRLVPTFPTITDIVTEPSPDSILMVPLIGSAAAGIPMPANQDIEDHIPISKDWLPATETSFFLRVRGDSMADGIMPGDLVLVNPKLVPTRSEIIVAMIEDEAAVKRYYPQSDRVILRSDNPAYADIVVASDFRIVGKVAGLLRRYR